jgi:hypothetical protein
MVVAHVQAGSLEVISGMSKNMIRKMISDALFFSEL